MTAPRRRRDQARLPDPRARGQRQAARLPRLRVVVAEAARRARRDGRLLPRATTPTSTAACTRSPRRRPPRTRQARRKVARFVNAPPTPRRSCSRATRPRRSTSSRTRGRAPTCSAGDAIVLSHMEHHANVVPWHMLAAERGVELRWIPLTDDFRLDLVEPRRAARRRQAPRDQRDVERARHDQRHPAARRRRARGRRARARRRVPVRAARRHRRAGVGRRLRRVLRAQDAAARAASARCGPGTSCSRRCRRSSAAAR